MQLITNIAPRSPLAPHLHAQSHMLFLTEFRPEGSKTAHGHLVAKQTGTFTYCTILVVGSKEAYDFKLGQGPVLDNLTFTVPTGIWGRMYVPLDFRPFGSLRCPEGTIQGPKLVKY